MAAWLVLTLISGATAQNIEPKVASQGDGQPTQVRQTLWIDKSQQQDFESVRAQVFKPFNPFERHEVGNKVVWLRMHIESADQNRHPSEMAQGSPHKDQKNDQRHRGEGCHRHSQLAFVQVYFVSPPYKSDDRRAAVRCNPEVKVVPLRSHTQLYF